MGSLSRLQGIFPTQGSNPGLLALQVDRLPAEPQGKPSKANPNFTLYSALDDLYIPPPQVCFYIQNVLRVPRVVGVLDELIRVI